ncbi:hypothetical protein ACLB2K_031599 [Fragaria x ananassa]
MESENPDTQDLVIRMREKLSLQTLDRSVRLAAVIFADKVPHKPSTIDMMKIAWLSFGVVGITARDERDPTDRLFVVTVRNEEAAKDIMENSPWSVKGYSVHVQLWPDHLAIEELPTNKIAVWIQMRGVPPYMYSITNVEEMVEHFGVFITMDDPVESGDGSYCFLRVRVMLDVRRPLPTGFTLPREDGSPSWVEFKYERLSRFCFCCGRLGHIETTQNPCPNSEEQRRDDIVYGEWMITSAFRRPGQVAQVIRPARSRRSAGQRIVPAGHQQIGQSSQPKSNQRRESSPHHSRPMRAGKFCDLTSSNPSTYQSLPLLSLGIYNGQKHVNQTNQKSLHRPMWLHQLGHMNHPTQTSKRSISMETSEPATQKKAKTSIKLGHFVKSGGTKSTSRQYSNSGTLQADESIGGDLLQGGGGWPTASRPQ